MKVLEKFQNKKVFALYLVGVLLLSAGVSFAYFSANSSVTGGGSVATNTTATIKSEGVQADGNISFSNADIYPGHQAVASIRVTGTGNNTPIVFNVIFNGNNTFNTPINYTIYKVENNIDASYSCEVREGRVGLNKIYYEECTGNNINQLGTAIGSGTITQGEGKTILKSNEIILTEPDGKEIYYYVVFEYPNEEANQNDDIGSIISGNITIEKGSEYTNPSVMFVGNTTSGNNGWYKSVSLTSNITTQTGNYNVTYCVTTEDSCTPNQTASITGNSFTTALNSNANPQKLCVRITDEYNQIGEGCSEAYSVDGTNPSINITNTSVTLDSISVTVSGNDSHSGIAQYRFSSDNGNNYTDINTSDNNYTYTFNNLESGTSYNISVQIVDEAGNVNVVNRVIETEESAKTMEEILAGYNSSIRTDFTSGYVSTTTNQVFTAEDDNGTTYYFAGNPTDNWLYFSGFYWRIVRLNGNGTIRIIYNGSSTSNDLSIYDTSTFNRVNTTLNTFWNTYLASNAQYIDFNTGFCNDNTYIDETGQHGDNITYYIYGAFDRIVSNSNPSFACPRNTDYLTATSSNTGSKTLTYPIGIITADETVFAGNMTLRPNGTGSTQNYLNVGTSYWTYSPSFFRMNTEVYVSEDTVFSSGLSNLSKSREYGVRPVINLKADTLFVGTGTSTDPYVVVE